MKNLGVWLSLGIFLVGALVGFGRLQAKTEETSRKVEATEKKILDLEKEGAKELEDIKKENNDKLEEVKKENIKLDKNITEFSVEQKYIKEKINETNENLKILIGEVKKIRK